MCVYNVLDIGKYNGKPAEDIKLYSSLSHNIDLYSQM